MTDLPEPTAPSPLAQPHKSLIIVTNHEWRGVWEEGVSTTLGRMTEHGYIGVIGADPGDALVTKLREVFYDQGVLILPMYDNLSGQNLSLIVAGSIGRLTIEGEGVHAKLVIKGGRWAELELDPETGLDLVWAPYYRSEMGIEEFRKHTALLRPSCAPLPKERRDP